MSMLLVEQNASLALALADQAYLLETGTIVMGGEAAVIAGNGIRAPFLSRLLGLLATPPNRGKSLGNRPCPIDL